VLGSAIFDIAGLTFQGPLDDFWQSGAAPDPALFEAFRKVVLTQAQINGSFFTEAGIDVGIETAIEQLGVVAVQPQTAPVYRPEQIAPDLAEAKTALIARH
jgi:capsular polysaccharide export protein